MKQRHHSARIKAANDNDLFWNRAAARPARDLSQMPFIQRRRRQLHQDQLCQSGPLGQPEPFRTGARPLLITALSALVLVALCGAFLIGLAFVGLLAVVVVAFELARGQLSRPAKAAFGALDHQVVG
jgi:hypothetical protein